MYSKAISGFVRARPFTYLILIVIIPLVVTAPRVLLDSVNPGELVIDPPESHEPLSEGFLLIILDGVGEDWLLDEDYMPLINDRRDNAATLHLRTGPLTLSATCVSELMTGVPNSPSDGLRNFNLGHPGGWDPWILASGGVDENSNSLYEVGMVGSYVFGNIYGDMENIQFTDTFLGHADFYEGDEATAEIMYEWMENGTFNMIGAHFSGPDKVAHMWGTSGEKYADKLSHVDALVDSVMERVPENWTIVITADHGMTILGTHGSSQDITREVAAIVWGSRVIVGSEAEAHQRDLPALTIATLDLPFPVQLHGRIPLDILDLSDTQRRDLEEWNWNAAVERQVFLQSIGRPAADDVQSDHIEWEKIPVDAEFTRPSDLLISVSIWILLASTAILLLGMNRPTSIDERRATSIFVAILVVMVMSHAFIDVIAVLPRLIGALCSIWIVWWALGDSKNKRGVEMASAEDGGTDIFPRNRFTSMPNWWPWLAASLVLSFSSFRFWFALIPLSWIMFSRGFVRDSDSSGKPERIALLIMGAISLVGVTGVHERLVGEHWVLALVQYGWPDTMPHVFFSVLILAITGPISCYLVESEETRSESLFLSFWLLLALFINWIGDSSVDRLMLLSISVLGLLGISQRMKIIPESILNLLPFRKKFNIAALGSLLVLTWGAWSAAITLLLLSSIDILMRNEWKWITTERYSLDNAKPFVAAAILPLVMWSLWWTMLGQVNGLEAWGLPHPRELDPGRLLVRGGYIGFREDPSTKWMAMIIVLPLLISSTALVSRMKEKGLSLRPYALALSLQIVGCITTLAFSPPFPRLVFSLTWNIIFSVFQICSVVLVLGLEFLIKGVDYPAPPRETHTTTGD